MRKHNFSLTSNMYKVLAMILTLSSLSLSVFLSIYIDLWYVLLLSWVVTCLMVFAAFVFYLNRIVVDLQKRQIIIYTLKRTKLEIDNIVSATVNTDYSVDSRKYCFIVFNMKDGSTYKFSGYSSLFKKEDVKRTQSIINILNGFLQEN